LLKMYAVQLSIAPTVTAITLSMAHHTRLFSAARLPNKAHQQSKKYSAIHKVDETTPRPPSACLPADRRWILKVTGCTSPPLLLLQRGGSKDATLPLHSGERSTRIDHTSPPTYSVYPFHFWFWWHWEGPHIPY